MTGASAGKYVFGQDGDNSRSGVNTILGPLRFDVE
jgi:hypothetical protein